MSVATHPRFIVRNTFLDTAPTEPLARRSGRSRSVPPLGGADRFAPEDTIQAKQLALLDALASRPRQGPIVLDGHGASSTTCGTSGDRTPSSGTDGTETIDSCSRQAPVGSLGHATGACRPCTFMRSAAGCKHGESCGYCHEVSGHVETSRSRPCKGKRMRIRKAMLALEAMVAEDPDLLATGQIHLPPYMESSPDSRARAWAQLAQIAEDAYTQRGGK